MEERMWIVLALISILGGAATVYLRLLDPTIGWTMILVGVILLIVSFFAGDAAPGTDDASHEDGPD
jgi:hypothetical protein